MKEVRSVDPYELVETGLKLSHRAGADEAEAFFLEHSSLAIEVRGGKLETLRQSKERGIGLRVLKGGSLGYAFTSDLSSSALTEAAQAAVANAACVTPDEARLFPAPADWDRALAQYDPAIAGTPIEAKIDLALGIEQAAFAHDRRITKSERAAYEEGEYQVAIANSHGLKAGYRGNFCGGYAWVVAEEAGDSETGSGLFYTTKLGELDAGAIGREAAHEAVQLLGAKPIPTQKLALVLPPQAATQFLGILAPALTAEAVQKKRSLFAGRLGEQVGAAAVTIIDDGTLPGGINTSPVDGEGVPTQRTTLVAQGRLENFLHNAYTAAKEGKRSTGNGMRSSFKGAPEVGPTNMFIAPGHAAPQELIAGVDKGLYVLDLMGTHTANPISGDFSLGATGILIEHGRFTQPVRGVVIAGNAITLLKEIQAAASDLRFYLGFGSPTLVLGPLTVSGA